MPNRVDKCIVIAEACGWKHIEHVMGDDGWYWIGSPPRCPTKEYQRDLPDYFTDLNTCAEALRVIEKRGLWQQYMANFRAGALAEPPPVMLAWLAHTAAPAQIAEALWKTFKGVDNA